MIVRKQVNPDGTLPGLESMAGEEVIVVRARTERVAKALEKPLAVLDDIRRFVLEHRDLTRRQVEEFTARYGNPADKARAYAKNLNADEFKAKVRELNDLVEKRLDTITKDLEKRYDELEREVEATIEKVFAVPKKAEGEPPAPAETITPTEPAKEKPAKKGGSRGGS